MEVNYVTTLDDFVRLQVHRHYQSLYHRIQFYFVLIRMPVVSLILLILYLIYFTDPTRGLVQTGLVTIAFIWPLLYAAFYRSGLEKELRLLAEEAGIEGVVGQITLTLTDETLTERTQKVTIVARWSDIKGIEFKYTTMYIHLTGTHTVIVPQSGFELPEEYDAVRAIALSKIHQHQLTSENAFSCFSVGKHT